MVVTVSPKYQVVIPKEVREALELEAGAKVSVIAKGGIAYIVPVPFPSQVKGLAAGFETQAPIRDKKDRVA